jgi:patatin-like phospholipase/acyl hydrolase
MPAARAVRADLKRRGRHYVTILALDGGGIRGVIPARIVQSLEERTGLRAHQLFDIIAGTSTGGIIALALTTPADDKVSARYSAADLVGLYQTHGPQIFSRTLVHKVVSGWGALGPKYSADSIERILRNYFRTSRLSDALTPVLVTSYDTATASPYFFKSYRSPDDSTSGARIPDDFLMWQAARATSAAPTYFPPFRLPCPDGSEKSLLDGGVFANNPGMCALADAYKMHRGSESPQYLVVSVGTGNEDLRLKYADVAGRGLLRWALPILKIVFDGVSDTVDYEAEEMADWHRRFQKERVGAEMDDASPETIQRLLDAANELIAERETDLAEVARRLKENVVGSERVA